MWRDQSSYLVKGVVIKVPAVESSVQTGDAKHRTKDSAILELVPGQERLASTEALPDWEQAENDEADDQHGDDTSTFPLSSD